MEALKLPPRQIEFTKYRPFGEEEEQTAIEWPDVRVGKLVMVEKYTGVSDDNTTLVILVLAAILLFVILFNK